MLVHHAELTTTNIAGCLFDFTNNFPNTIQRVPDSRQTPFPQPRADAKLLMDHGFAVDSTPRTDNRPRYTAATTELDK
jgi:hypothetical protein